IEASYTDRDYTVSNISNGQHTFAITAVYENYIESDAVLYDFINCNIKIFIVFMGRDGSYYTYYLKTLKGFNTEHLISNASPYECTELKTIPAFVRDERRQNQAIEFLKERGLIRKSAIERFFANRVAGFKGLWDVDMFEWIDNKRIKAYEVKQKFPAANGCFGINQGTTKFLLFLAQQDVDVEHVILKKPIDDKDIPALDFIMKPEYAGHNEWLSTEFSDTSIQSFLTKKSPCYTSIHGNYKLTYYDMDMRTFQSRGLV
ncbi:MAG: hypothetical protein WC218_09530, partial [Candidatus Cloacimonadales bacterium]